MNKEPDPNQSIESVTTIPKLTEFETKYRVENDCLMEFKKIVEKLPGFKKFLYVEGPDSYFTKSDGSFARYRRPSHELDGKRSEVTVKSKPKEAKNNIIRREINWRVDGTPEESITEGLIDMGYIYNFTIWKSCHIYFMKDAVLVFYSVYDITENKYTKGDTFIECELNEDTIHNLTEDQAWEIITKYEKLLEPVGINPQKRLRKSLYEMYVRDIK